MALSALDTLQYHDDLLRAGFNEIQATVLVDQKKSNRESFCNQTRCAARKYQAGVSYAVRHGGRRPRRIVPGRRGWTGKTGVCCSLAGVRLYPGSYTSRPVIWEPRTESAARSRSCRRRGRPGQQITCGVVRVDLGHGRPKSITR